MCNTDNCSCSNSSNTCPAKEVDCCRCPEKMDCCTPQFQRLDRLSTTWLFYAMGSHVNDDSLNRLGEEENNDDDDGFSNLARDFVWASRALNIENCKEEQVWGWTVNLSTGNLVLMQDTDGVSSDKTRSDILGENSSTISIADKKAKQVLNRFYHMSEKALVCNKYPKTEGVMVVVTDSCNQKWLLLVNRATGRDSIMTGNEYVIVGAKL